MQKEGARMSINGYSTATYRLYDDTADFQKKAQAIAVGLTVGSWTELPETAKRQMEKHLGQVISVDVHEPDGSAAGERYADVTIGYPDLNFSRDLPALLVTVFGKLSMDGRIKLLDLQPSADFLRAFPGPKFGVRGVRDLLGVHDRPLVMSIFKSVIGYDLDGLREQFLQQALGGVDLIKDDEILFENPLSPLEKRVKVCIDAAREAHETTGQKLIYFTNLTGPTFKLRDNAKRAIEAGANGLLFNVLSYGFDALAELTADPDIRVRHWPALCILRPIMGSLLRCSLAS
jgi:2,3-diketo-5-methylthiopentyl-1-phosphate enolase